MAGPRIGQTFDWGGLGRCTVERLQAHVVKFRAPNGVLYQVSRDYWLRMADNIDA
jgi:hypothetical protein